MKPFCYFQRHTAKLSTV